MFSVQYLKKITEENSILCLASYSEQETYQGK